MTTKTFVSYSHEGENHSDWVLQLATRLRSNGVDVILDRWNLQLGGNLGSFIDQGLSESNRVLCVCSQGYVEKANSGISGVGYEKTVITAELLSDSNTDWVIPAIRDNLGEQIVPRFLRGRRYVDFREDRLYESKYEELLRVLLNEPVLPIPPLGENPFRMARQFANQKFIPGSEKYVSPAPKGRVTFDYSNNNGRYCIGSGELMFETQWSKASDRRIYLYNDPANILSVAVVKDTSEICAIEDARRYDGSSRNRTPGVGQVAILRNANGFFAALKILEIKDDTRGSAFDEVTFDYVIQTNGTPDFRN